MNALHSIALVLFTSVASCAPAFESARMQPPAGMGPVDTIPVDGIGGGNSGDWRVAEFGGSWRRSETLLDSGGYDRRRSTAAFSLGGPLLETPLDVACRMDALAITVGVVNFRPEPVAWRCLFSTAGRSIPARFELQEARQGLIAQEIRAGEIALDRVILEIRSVHRIAGSSLRTKAPSGYVFSLDSRPVGAVDMTGQPRMMLPAGGDPAVRRAVAAAAMAVILFRDPAQSGLGDW